MKSFTHNVKIDHNRTDIDPDPLVVELQLMYEVHYYNVTMDHVRWEKSYFNDIENETINDWVNDQWSELQSEIDPTENQWED